MSEVKKPVSRLGRGLSSLISSAPLPVEIELGSPAAGMQSSPEIPLANIQPNPHQPRRTMNESSVAELAASLKTNGLIQPIIVRRLPGSPDSFELIAGERRFRAAKLAGLTTIPAIVRDVDSMTQAQMALVENVQREDLNPIDRAVAYRSLMQQLGLTQADLGTRLGEDRSSVANYLRLLELAEPVRNLLRDGQLTMGHAKLLAGVTEPAEQERLAKLVLSQGLSVRNLERLTQGAPAATETPIRGESQPISAHLADLEKSVTRQLGMRVQIRSAAKGRGRLIVHYSSLDQFDDLLARMDVKPE